MRRLLVFVVNLVQDVAIFRPLVKLARERFDCDIAVLCTTAFSKRDPDLVWSAELDAMTEAFGAEVMTVETPYDALGRMQGRRGIVFAASESELSNHQIVHDILRCAPQGFLKVTMQHGLECVGFAHNLAHDRAHGERVGFAADIVVGWSTSDLLYSMRADQRAKLFVAGPPSLIEAQGRAASRKGGERHGMRGLICENLHSVRISTDMRSTFVEILREFARSTRAVAGVLELRPHPGGRFTDKNKIALPEGVTRNNLPLFKQDLGRFDFGVSAPSTILLDMILADVPAAVWHSDDDSMDLSNFEGLPMVHSAGDWWAFACEAVASPESLLARQRAFLSRLQFPANVAQRYTSLLAATE